MPPSTFRFEIYRVTGAGYRVAGANVPLPSGRLAGVEPILAFRMFGRGWPQVSAEFPDFGRVVDWIAGLMRAGYTVEFE